jgi:hypothetical protein
VFDAACECLHRCWPLKFGVWQFAFRTIETLARRAAEPASFSPI